MGEHMITWARACTAALALLIAGCAGDLGSPTQTEPAEEPAAGTEATDGLGGLAAEPGPDRTEQLVELAREDGDPMLVYSSNPPEEFQAIIGAFEEEYGLTVEHYRAGGTDIIQRVTQEVQAGAQTADVISANDNVVYALDASEGITSPFVSEHHDAYDTDLRVSENSYPVYVNYWMWAYNTDMVDEDELPRTYEDLLDERWQGEITIARYTDWFAGMHQILGDDAEEYLDRLAAQDPLIADQFTPAILPVISQERSLTISTTSGVLAGEREGGAPIDGYFPDDPTVSRAQSVAWINDGGNPAGGLLFAEFLLHPEHGQVFMREANRVPAHDAVAADPAELRPDEFVPIDYAAFLPEQAMWESRFDQVLINR
ncbi:MAG: extracellular solute-binding protein [Nitriliruptorales bacterium]|nr:extracellular solute-binding protein [Nitriliruptorales bacterium]